MARHINLLDAPEKKTNPYAKALQMGVPIGLTLLLMGGWSTVVHFKVAAVKRQLNAIDAQLQPVQDELSQLQANMGMEQVNTSLRERLAQVEARLKAHKDIQLALQRGDLGSTQGFSEFMRAFAHQVASGAWLTGLLLDNSTKEITITGRALNAEAVANLVRQLRAEPVLKGRSIAMVDISPLAAAPDAQASGQAEAVASAAPATTPIYTFKISSISDSADNALRLPAASAAPSTSAESAQ